MKVTDKSASHACVHGRPLWYQACVEDNEFRNVKRILELDTHDSVHVERGRRIINELSPCPGFYKLAYVNAIHGQVQYTFSLLPEGQQ